MSPELIEIRRRVRLIEVQNEGAGGNRTPEEIATAMKWECRRLISYIDSLDRPQPSPATNYS